MCIALWLLVQQMTEFSWHLLSLFARLEFYRYILMPSTIPPWGCPWQISLLSLCIKGSLSTDFILVCDLKFYVFCIRMSWNIRIFRQCWIKWKLILFFFIMQWFSYFPSVISLLKNSCEYHSLFFVTVVIFFLPLPTSLPQGSIRSYFFSKHILFPIEKIL